MTNKEVVQAFMNGKVGASGRMSTDGKFLYSYNLKIGWTAGINKDQKLVYDYTARNNAFQSVTTSKHVRLAENAGARLVPVQTN
jgi:hypothetical protein